MPNEPLEIQLQRERLARIRIESQLEEARLQIVEMEMTMRQLRELLGVATGGLPFSLSSESISPEPEAPAESVTAVEVEAPASPAPVAAEAIAAEPVPDSRGSASPPRKRSSRRSTKAAPVAAAPEPIDADFDLDESDGGTATLTRHEPPPILSTLPLHEADNREVIKEFISHTHTRVEKMQGTLASMNLKELKWHTIWLKEHAAEVGFEVLVEPLAQLEEAIESEDDAMIGEKLDAFIQLTDRIALEPSRK